MKPPKKGSFLDGNRLQAAYWLNAIVGKFAYWLNAIVGKFAYWLNAIVSESAYWLNAILFHEFRLAQRYSFALKTARLLSKKTARRGRFLLQIGQNVRQKKCSRLFGQRSEAPKPEIRLAQRYCWQISRLAQRYCLALPRIIWPEKRVGWVPKGG